MRIECVACNRRHYRCRRHLRTAAHIGVPTAESESIPRRRWHRPVSAAVCYHSVEWRHVASVGVKEHGYRTNPMRIECVVGCGCDCHCRRHLRAAAHRCKPTNEGASRPRRRWQRSVGGIIIYGLGKWRHSAEACIERHGVLSGLICGGDCLIARYVCVCTTPSGERIAGSRWGVRRRCIRTGCYRLNLEHRSVPIDERDGDSQYVFGIKRICVSRYGSKTE